jgi:hypothetical protein
MNNSTKAKVLSAGLAVMTLFGPIAVAITASSCETGTNGEVMKDFTIPGRNVIIRGLPSLAAPYVDNFVRGLDGIYAPTSSGAPIDLFKNYVSAIGRPLVIVVEDAPEYGTYNYRIISQDSCAVRSAFLATNPNMVAELIAIVTGLNSQYNLVSLGKQFGNAKEIVRMAFRQQRGAMQKT